MRLETETQTLHFDHPTLPALSYPVREAWRHNGVLVAVTFRAGRMPAYQDMIGFHLYEGVSHPALARYHYGVLGDLVLAFPNKKLLQSTLREVRALRFPWETELRLAPGPVTRWEEVPPVVGTRPLQVGV